MPQNNQCDQCKHFNGIRNCNAFPYSYDGKSDGIPYEIISGQFDHTKPYPGDNGIRFEQNDFSKLWLA